MRYGAGYDRVPPPSQSTIELRSRRPWRCWNGVEDVTMWDPRRMYHFRWKFLSVQNGIMALAAYRTLVVSYLLSTVLTDWAQNTNPGRYPAFLTNWSIWSAILHFATDAIIGWSMWIYCMRNRNLAPNRYPKHIRDPCAADTEVELQIDVSPGHWTRHIYRLSLIIFEISSTFEFMVLGLYWSMLYPLGHPSAEKAVWINSTVHAVGAATLFIDLWLGCHRPIDVHSALVVLVALVYCVVNYVVTTQTGEALYSILTWDDSGSWLLAAGALVAMFLVFFVVSAMAWLRDRVARKGRNACVWKRPSRAAAMGLDGTFSTGLFDVSANDSTYGGDDDVSDDEDVGLDWYEAVRTASSTGNGRLPLFSPPRFLDTRKAFPCSTCHDNACKPRPKSETFKGWHLVQQEAMLGDNRRTFTGTESDARSDSLFPI